MSSRFEVTEVDAEVEEPEATSQGGHSEFVLNSHSSIMCTCTWFNYLFVMNFIRGLTVDS